MVSSSSASYLGCAHCQSPPHQSLLSRVSSPSESYLGWRIPGFTSRLQGTEMQLLCWTNTVLGHPSVSPPNSTHSYLGSMGACSWPQEAPHQPEGEDEGDQGLLTWECSSCSLLKSWRSLFYQNAPPWLGAGRDCLCFLSQGYCFPGAGRPGASCSFLLSLPHPTPLCPSPCNTCSHLSATKPLCDRNTHNSDSHSCDINREPLGRHWPTSSLIWKYNHVYLQKKKSLTHFQATNTGTPG